MVEVSSVSASGAGQRNNARVSIDTNHELRIRAAWIYYIEGLTQQETAAILGRASPLKPSVLMEKRS